MNKKSSSVVEISRKYANGCEKIKLQSKSCFMWNRRKNPWTLVLTAMAGAGLLMGGCGPRDNQGAQQMGPPEVGVVTIQPERIVLTKDLPGRTAAYRVAEIRPQVNGLILKRSFKEGANVKAGDLLYQIDPSPYQAAYDQAAAAVSMAEANLTSLRLREKRFKQLAANRAVGQQDYDDALAALQHMEAQLKSSQAALVSARINLSYTPIKAPISGYIGRSSVTEGALVTAYQAVPLATIQQLDPIYVDVTQSTAEVLRLDRQLAEGRLTHNGQNQNAVELILDDGTTYARKGTLQFRDITVDPTTGSVILRAVFPNPDGTLLPGMFVYTILQEGIQEEAILVSQSGVNRNHRGEPYVLVVDESGKVDLRMVTIDRAIGDRWLVSNGLNPNDQVIVEGVQKVKPGASVKVVRLPSGREDGSAGEKTVHTSANMK